MTQADVVLVERELPPYFAVSLFKFAVMFVATGGLYQLWWFYKNWCRVRVREQSSIWPAWRAVFAFFWCYACICRIRSTATSLELPISFPAGPLTVAWIINSLLVYLPDPWWLVSLLAFVWLLPAQAVANRVNLAVAPNHDPNSAFSGWNIAAIVINGCLLTLVCIGMIVRSR